MLRSVCQIPAVLWCCVFLLILSESISAQSNGSYQSFQFRKFEVTVLSPYQLIHVNDDNAQYVNSLIREELESAGLVFSSSPDFFVDVSVSLRWQRQFSRGVFFGQPVYQVGTLTVKLTKVENDVVLWEGSNTTPLWKVKEKRMKNRVDNIVAKVFKNFDLDTASAD